MAGGGGCSVDVGVFGSTGDDPTSVGLRGRVSKALDLSS